MWDFLKIKWSEKRAFRVICIRVQSMLNCTSRHLYLALHILN